MPPKQNVVNSTSNITPAVHKDAEQPNSIAEDMPVLYLYRM
jgi:hypothetical protein